MSLKNKYNLFLLLSLVLLAGLIVLIMSLGSKSPRIVRAEGDFLFQTENVDGFQVTWGQKDNPSQITFSKGDSAIALDVPIENAEWIQEGGKLKVKQGSVSFIYSLLKTNKGEARGIKEEIVLDKRLDSNLVFAFPVKVKNLEPKEENGTWHFYYNNQDLFYIPKPFMVDANGKKSEDVKILVKDNSIRIIPNTDWLQAAERKYPVTIDPSIELTILSVYSHPQTGDIWSVNFKTEGTADLKIIPNDQATINDLDFVSLKCGDTEKSPQILENDVIYFPNWDCNQEAEVNHYVKKADKHTLRFEFGDQIKYAYNDPDVVTDPFDDASYIDSLENTAIVSGIMRLKQVGEIFCGVDDVTFTYNGSEVTYGTVEGDAGECWLDRNLGASQVATSKTDSNAYGDLFQWGRCDDGHQDRSSATYSSQASTFTCEGGNDWDGKFVKGYSDWLSSPDDTLWSTSTLTNNPCPEGWRVPTKAEWEAEIAGWGSPYDDAAYNSPLKLTLAGYRSYSSGSVYLEGSYGYYWSSTVDGSSAYYLNFYSGYANMYSFNRASGYSVRCVRGQ